MFGHSVRIWINSQEFRYDCHTVFLMVYLFLPPKQYTVLSAVTRVSKKERVSSMETWFLKTNWRVVLIALLLARLPVIEAAEPLVSAKPLVPPGWDPALAGDDVMNRLVTVTAPQVKGAHDAELVVVDRLAYIVAEVNDVKAGESAGWPEIYCAMSIVNLDTLAVEAAIPFARSEQAFENETLPVGACFVPRILQKDERTLRCYFASEQPGKRQAQTWERKYHFETTKSFQYPTFREHDGTVWLCVTQGDSSGSRKERIMFGKLEKVGGFESQVGKTRKPIPAPPEQPAMMQPRVKLFTDRDYTLVEAPDFLLGRRFPRTSIEGYEVECVKPGEVFVITLSKPHFANQGTALLQQGFKKVDTPEFQLFPGQINRVFAWRKVLNPGDRLRFKKLAFLVTGKDTEVALVKPKKKSPEDAAARIQRMEKVADLALVPPVLNTSPLPAYDCDQLDPLRGANVFVSADQGKTWERRGVVRFPNPDWHEHMIVERKDGSLWMLARTVKGIMQSTSTDGGRTWETPTEPAGILQPNARFFFRRLSSGRILLIKHGDQIDAHHGRVQLSAWLSADDGKTWQGGLVLDERKGISYPDGLQAPDGTIYISYHRNRAIDGEILLARFTEEDVLDGKIVGLKSKLKMLISRPGKKPAK